MKKLTICEIGTMDTKGGAARVSWSIKTELEKLGHEVTMIVGYKKSSDPKVLEIFDTPCNRILSSIIKRNVYQRVSHHLAYWLSNDIWIPLAKKVDNIPAVLNADIIHAHNLHTNFFNLDELPRLSHQKPFVWTLHDMWAITGHSSHSFDCEHWKTGGCSCVLADTIPPHRINNSQKLWEKKKKIYEWSKLHIVVPSQWLCKKVKDSILRHHDIHCIYNGVNTTIFSPQEKKATRKKLGIPLDATVILFLSKGGKKNIWKGWEYSQYIIDREKNNPRMLFLCMGGYEKNAQEVKNLKYIPFTPNQNVLAEYYSASDILLYPSIADNCPLTVLEAMACGLPILSFATGGIPELVKHKIHGYIAQYKNETDLYRGLQYLTALLPAEYGQMSYNCRKNVLEKFGLDLMVQKYLEIYYAILNNIKTNTYTQDIETKLKL